MIEMRYKLLPHHLSPVMAPSHFHLFPKLKTFLDGQWFSSNEELVARVQEYFGGLEEANFSDGIEALEF